jgi:hypothetical protein
MKIGGFILTRESAWLIWTRVVGIAGLIVGGSINVAVAPVCTTFVAPDTSGFSCSITFPAFTPGAHALSLTASNAAGESAKSAPISFTMVLVPTVPGALRIQ